MFSSATEWPNASPLFIEREIEKYVEDKDAKNTKRSAKVARQVFQEYLKENKTTEPEEKTLFSSRFKNVLRYWVLHCCLIFSLRLSMYNKTIIEFGFRMIS